MTTLTANNHILTRVTMNGPRISGYMLIWGSPEQSDCYNTYIDKNDMPEMALEFLPIKLLYEHGLDPLIQGDIIGIIDRVEFDDVGVRFWGRLDSTSPHYDRVREELAAGLLATSTGSDQFADFAGDGKFKRWYINELSLTAIACEPRMPMVSLEKSAITRSCPQARGERCNCWKAQGTIPAQDSLHPIPDQLRLLEVAMATLDTEAMDAASALAILVEAYGEEAVMSALEAMQQPAQPPPAAANAEGERAEGEATPGMEIVAKLTQLLKEQKSAKDRAATDAAAAARLKTLEDKLAAMEAAVAAPPEENASPEGRRNMGDGISDLIDLRYDHMDARTMVSGYVWKAAAERRKLRKHGKPDVLSDEYVRAMANKVLADKAKSGIATRNSDFRSAFPIRANEIGQSTLASYGDEWVGVYYDSDMMETVRQATDLYTMMRGMGMMEKVIPRGNESATIVIEGADPTWYVAPQSSTESGGVPTATLTASKVGTGNVSVTLSKLGCVIQWTGELDEDSLVDMAGEARRKLDVTGAEMLEYTIINGDTTTGSSPANINYSGGTVAADSLGSLPYYTAWNGLLHIGLVTATTNAMSVGALDDSDFLALNKLLGTNGKSAEIGKIFYIMDNMTYFTCWDLPAVKTEDKSRAATIDNGQLKSIYNIPIYMSGQMGLALSTGFVSSTAASNTLGRIVLVRPDQWAFAWHRRTTTELDRFARADVTQLVTYMRAGFVSRNSEDCAAVAYNITV